MENNQKKVSGHLYVVATPIGNLEDMTFRAVRILKSVDLIAAEDTRHTGKLLAHYGIKNRLVSCHDHNEASRIPDFIDKMKNGQHIALVSDAGTPSVSDPGYRLVFAAVNDAIQVIPIPGPSAAIAGLSVSGLPTDQFYFSGFPARKTGKRLKEIKTRSQEPSTLIFYESPNRIIGLIEEIKEVFGDRPAMLAREITKLHEEYVRGRLSEILMVLTSRESVKGECTLFVKGYGGTAELSSVDLDAEIFRALQKTNCGTSSLAGQLSKTLGVSKKTVYDRIVSLKNRK